MNQDLIQDLTDDQAEGPASYDLDAMLAEPEKPITFDVAVISDADGKPVSGFRIVGRNSDEYRKVDKALKVANQQAAAMRTKAIDAKTEAGATKVVSIVDRQNVARAAAVVVDWFGWTMKGEDGNPVPRPFDAKLVPGILQQKLTWVEKINAAMYEDNNFLPVLPTTSASTPDNS